MKKFSWKHVGIAFLLLCVVLAGTAVFGFVVYKLNTKINNLSMYTQTLEADLQSTTSEMEQIQESLKKRIVNINNKDGSTTIVCTTDYPSSEYCMYQLSMNDLTGGFCYAIELPNGEFVMIDSGNDGDAVAIKDFLLKNGAVVNSWFITHPHADHIGGLLNLLSQENNGGIEIKNIYYNPFTSDFFEKEAEGKDLPQLNNAVMFEEFETSKTEETEIKFHKVAQNEQLKFDDMVITCLNSFNPQLYDVNGNSLVLHIDIKGVKLMVTGDITDTTLEQMKKNLGEESNYWEVGFLQIPHHGYIAGISSDELYRLTMPRYVLLDCSTSEYDDNAINIRQHLKWITDLEVPVLKRFKGPNMILID